MANKYLLGLKRYLMRKVGVCTSKLSCLGSVYKLTMLTHELRSDLRAAIFASSRYCEAWQSHDIIRLCKTETKLLFTWFNFVISPYAWLHVTCIHWEMSASWPGKTDNWQNVLCSYHGYDPICAQIMAIKTWYYQNWDRYMCGFLITSTTSDCAIVEKYVSKHVNLVISGAVKTLECNWVTSVQRCQHKVRHSVPSSLRQRRLERKFDWFDDNLYWYQLGDQSLTHQGLSIFLLLVLWFGVFFIEKSSRESVEAISGLAVFDGFYQDSGRKSACVNDVQSPRAA